jgi:hypothetical protein
MQCYILRTLSSLSNDMIDRVFNKLGLSSIALTVTTTTAQASQVPIINEAVFMSFTSADIALTVSSLGGVLFCIEKVIMIYIRYKEARKP